MCNASGICQPSRQRVDTVGNIWAKLLSVTVWNIVWKPVHEVHNRWLFPTVRRMRVRVKEIPTPVQLCFVQLADECQVQNPPWPFLVLSTRVIRWSNQQQRFRVLNQLSAFGPAIGFVQISISSRQALSVHLHALLQPLQVSLPSRNVKRELFTRPPSPFQCRSSFDCFCCYCCPQLEALLDSPCSSTVASVISVFPNPVLQVTVVQGAVAQAVAQVATPNRCCCYCYSLPWAAQEAASLRPQGDGLLR